MKAKIDITSDDIRTAIKEYVERKLGLEINRAHIVIEVKSTQNYKSEWEIAQFRARYDHGLEA